LAFAVETADAEARAANVERHNPHLVAQEFSHISGIDPDVPQILFRINGPQHLLSINQAPVSAADCAMTHDVPYGKAISTLTW
jgi:hypothetical protein